MLKSSAEIIIKAASEQKNIRIANLISNLISPDPFASSIHSTDNTSHSSNPILEGGHSHIISCIAQQVSALFSVHKLEQANAILHTWSISRLCNPLVFSSLLSGLVSGRYFKEAVAFYEWCRQHTVTAREEAALRSTVTVALLVQAYEELGEFSKALALFALAEKEKVVVTTDVWETVIGVLDTKHVWREKYREMIRKDKTLTDRTKCVYSVSVMVRREALQSRLILEQLCEGVRWISACDELRERVDARCFHRGAQRGRSGEWK